MCVFVLRPPPLFVRALVSYEVWRDRFLGGGGVLICYFDSVMMACLMLDLIGSDWLTVTYRLIRQYRPSNKKPGCRPRVYFLFLFENGCVPG